MQNTLDCKESFRRLSSSTSDWKLLFEIVILRISPTSRSFSSLSSQIRASRSSAGSSTVVLAESASVDGEEARDS